MRFAVKKKIFFGWLFLICGAAALQADTFLGKVPTGNIEVKDARYPVSVYVPETYNAEKTYPFLVIIPDLGVAPDKYIQEWTGLAKKKNLILLVPSLQVQAKEDVPYAADRWLFGLKRNIERHYRVDSNRVYLVGENLGAQYAAYLGVKYPREFSAVGLIGGSWAGPLERLIEFRRSPRNQRPFLVVLDQADESLVKETEKVAYKMTQKGYPVYLKKAALEELSVKNQQKPVLEWLEQQQKAWAQIIAESQKSWKAKTAKAVEEFIEVK